MSCKDLNCVCDAVQNINDIQDAVEEQCPTSCYENLLAPTNLLGDTIPFMLLSKKGEPFKAYGNVGGLDDGECFTTVFFRVERFRDDCCATLSLLRPFSNGQPTDCHDDVCDVTSLEKTDYCIEVDLTCFCAIQCLNPRLVD